MSAWRFFYNIGIYSTFPPQSPSTPAAIPSPLRGASDQRLTDVGREAVAGCGALEMRRQFRGRRSKPRRPGVPTARRWAPLTAAAGTVRSAGHRLGPLAVDKRSRLKGRLKGKSTGGGAEQASHTARGAPGNRHLAATIARVTNLTIVTRGCGACCFVCATSRERDSARPRRSARPRFSRARKSARRKPARRRRTRRR